MLSIVFDPLFAILIYIQKKKEHKFQRDPFKHSETSDMLLLLYPLEG